MGIESDHRTLARVLWPDVAAQDGGPIEKIAGIQGEAESVDPPNNNGYERTLRWTNIGKAVTALTPFADKIGRWQGRVRYEQAVQVQALYADATPAAGRIPLIRRLSNQPTRGGRATGGGSVGRWATSPRSAGTMP